MQLTVRKGTLSDHQNLTAFNQKMAWETEKRKLDPEVLAQGVRRVLLEEVPGFYLICEATVSNSEPVTAGGLLIQLEWSDWRGAYFWWIHSVYVIPEFRRKGVYKALVAGVEREARKAVERTGIPITGYRLYVEKENSVAQKTYLEQGMHECHYAMFEQTRKE